jgi:hypothetical protein
MDRDQLPPLSGKRAASASGVSDLRPLWPPVPVPPGAGDTPDLAAVASTVQMAGQRGSELLRRLSDLLSDWAAFFSPIPIALYDPDGVRLPGAALSAPPVLKYTVPLTVRGQQVATLVAASPPDARLRAPRFRELTLELGVVLAEVTAWGQTEAERRGEKIQALMAHGWVEPVIGLMALCGLDLHGRYTLFCVEMAKIPRFQHMDVLRRYLVRHIWEYRPVFPWIAYQPDGLLALLPQSPHHQEHQEASRWLDRWQRQHPDLPLRAYLEEVPSLPLLDEAIRQVTLLFRIAESYGLQGLLNGLIDRHSARLLAEMPREALAQLVYRTLGLLLDPTHAVLRDTLTAYLAHRQSPARAAEVLFVHPNTVLYRVRQAEQLLGVDLKDTEQLTTVWLALQGYGLLSRQPGTSR